MLTDILSSLLFCLSANLDNIVIGIAYGAKHIQMKLLPNLCIAFITSLSTLIAMYVGKFFIFLIPLQYIHKIGAFIFILLGIYFLLHNIGLKNTEDIMSYALKTDKDHSYSIDIQEALAVSCNLILNNIGIGMVASVSGISTFLVVPLTFLCSFLFIPLGIYIGNRFLGKLLGKFAPLASGILLILLGIIESIY